MNNLYILLVYFPIALSTVDHEVQSSQYESQLLDFTK